VSHLRDLVAALIDGELTHEERDRALAHLASCSACRSEVAAHRVLKERLAAAQPPMPSAGLLAQLHRMSEPGEPLPLTRRGQTETTRPPTVPVGRRPPTRGVVRPTSARSRARRRVQGVLVASAVAVTTTLVTAFAVGGEPVSDAVTPDVETYVVEHARASRVLPFADVPAEVVGVGLAGRPR
jgi:anti-sigma factor RsiW